MNKATKVELVRLFEAVSPLSKPIADATHQIPEIRFLVVRLYLSDGTAGEGYLLAFHYSQQASIGALRDAADAVIGREVSTTTAFNSECEAEHEYFGSIGLLRWAQAAINLAMWDAWGRHLGQPVWRLLGAHSNRVAGLWAAADGCPTRSRN